MHQLIKSIALVPLLFVCISLQAQSQDDKKYELAFLVGTIQPFLLDGGNVEVDFYTPKLVCLLYTSPSPRDQRGSRMPSSA